MRRVLGIDAGGTKTVGLLADETGQVLAEARAGGANLHLHGELAVEKVFHEILEQLQPRAPIDAVCLGSAGVERARDEEVARNVLRRLGLRQRVRVVHDAAIALVAGAPERVGLALLSGTGAIAYGVDRHGTSARSGGWGYFLADEGSAFWFGHQALRAVVRASDGRGAATLLLRLLLDRLGFGDVRELVPWIYDEHLPKYRVAELASLVQQAADRGDDVAEKLLEDAAGHLARMAGAVANQLKFESEYPLVLSGGAFKACPSLVERTVARCVLPLARPSLLACEPARGAVTLALDELR